VVFTDLGEVTHAALQQQYLNKLFNGIVLSSKQDVMTVTHGVASTWPGRTHPGQLRLAIQTQTLTESYEIKEINFLVLRTKPNKLSQSAPKWLNKRQLHSHDCTQHAAQRPLQLRLPTVSMAGFDTSQAAGNLNLQAAYMATCHHARTHCKVTAWLNSLQTAYNSLHDLHCTLSTPWPLTVHSALELHTAANMPA
jgi:hypothetical protein